MSLYRTSKPLDLHENGLIEMRLGDCRVAGELLLGRWSLRGERVRAGELSGKGVPTASIHDSYVCRMTGFQTAQFPQPGDQSVPRVMGAARSKLRRILCVRSATRTDLAYPRIPFAGMATY